MAAAGGVMIQRNSIPIVSVAALQGAEGPLPLSYPLLCVCEQPRTAVGFVLHCVVMKLSPGTSTRQGISGPVSDPSLHLLPLFARPPRSGRVFEDGLVCSPGATPATKSNTLLVSTTMVQPRAPPPTPARRGVSLTLLVYMSYSCCVLLLYCCCCCRFWLLGDPHEQAPV